MTTYAIWFPSEAMQLTPEEFPQVVIDTHAVVQEMKDAGVLVFAGGIDESIAPVLVGRDGSATPGGFGDRGTEGKIEAIRFAREKKIPFFGICLGMQLAVVEYARNVCGMQGANSAEFAPDAPYAVVDLMPDQRGVLEKGGTMRLGAYPCVLEKGSLAERAYGSTTIGERHRHRYEVNNSYRAQLEGAGLVVSGTSPDGSLVEFVELPAEVHPYYVGTQAHPEFQSRPTRPHPLFAGLIRAALDRRADAVRQANAEHGEATNHVGEPDAEVVPAAGDPA